MKMFAEKLAKLVEVRKLIALLISITLVSLAFMGKITSEQFLPLATTIIGYYFGASTVKNAK